MDVAASEFYKADVNKYDLDFKNPNSDPTKWLTGQVVQIWKFQFNVYLLLAIGWPLQIVCCQVSCLFHWRRLWPRWLGKLEQIPVGDTNSVLLRLCSASAKFFYINEIKTRRRWFDCDKPKANPNGYWKEVMQLFAFEGQPNWLCDWVD